MSHARAVLFLGLASLALVADCTPPSLACTENADCGSGSCIEGTCSPASGEGEGEGEAGEGEGGGSEGEGEGGEGEGEGEGGEGEGEAGEGEGGEGEGGEGEGGEGEGGEGEGGEGEGGEGEGGEGEGEGEGGEGEGGEGGEGEGEPLPRCGDGNLDAGEECDPAGALCDVACQRVPVCGDGFVDVPELCEDGNVEDGDGCSAACVPGPDVVSALVAHWPFEENNGAPIADASGNGINGTAQGNTTHSTSDFMVGARSLQLDGSNDFVDFGNPALLPAGTSARTLCSWGRPTTTADGFGWMAAYGTPSTGQSFFIGRNGNDLVAGGFNGDDVVVDNFWDANEWRHVCLSYDGSTARLYADGQQIASAPKNWNLVRLRTFVGRQVNNNEHWIGRVDDTRIYSRALSAADVEHLFTSVR